MNKNETNEKKKKLRLFDGILVLVCLGLFLALSWNNFFPPAKTVSPANVELYQFDDVFILNLGLNETSYVNVELWLKNTGDQKASDITCFIRSRDNTGAILYKNEIDLTALILNANETCSGTYSVPITGNETYLSHTIEVSWTAGKNSYQKKTIIKEE